MLSSVAERVYWMGRYLERAENIARLLNVYSAMLFDLPRGTTIGWRNLIEISGSHEEFSRRFTVADEKNIVRFLLADANNSSSIFSCLKNARENARTTREIIPSEGWEQINDLYLLAKENVSAGVARGRRHGLLIQLIAHCQQISGLLSGTMSHNEAYSFIQLGRRLERTDMTTRIVDVGSISLFPGFSNNAKERELLEPYENIVWMCVLRSLSAYQAYRQHVQSRVVGEQVVRYLLQDEAFPRAVNFCLNQVNYHLQKLPHHESVQRAVARVQRISKDAQISRLLEKGLLEYIDELQISIADIHEELCAVWFQPVEGHQKQLQSA